MTLLQVKGLDVAYGDALALRDVSLSIEPAAVTAVLGANGSGKTTLLRTLSGLLQPRAGEILLDGQRIAGLAPHIIVRRGLSHVPEGRGMLAELTVLENLELGAYSRGGTRAAGGLDRVFALFPVLAGRRHQQAGMLSGGEQQMLAIARSLLAGPRLLMIDELSLGLAPVVTTALMGLLERLRADGMSVLLVEQNVHQALQVADRVYMLVNGSIAFEGTPAALRAQGSLMSTYLGVD